MKFELGQVIYYIRENRVCSAPVLSRIRVENLYDSISDKEQTSLPYGYAREEYYTCHGTINEYEAFKSKLDLQKSLIGPM